tara:strand:+ start:51 stop:662 length:612 start_codon:yes stop_codon:yes gene_type:complete
MRSLSEIETVSKRASRASGFSWGVAEEVGKNIKILEMFGLPGIKNLNEYYKEKKEIKFENLNLINVDNKSVKSKVCPITVGINFLDQIKTLEVLNKINFEKIAYPLLFLPFLSRSSEIIGKRLFVKFDDKEFLLNFNNNIYSNSLKIGIIELAQNVSVKFINNTDLFTENEWHELYKLSENTFVEESDALKKAGAGAGLTDND